MSFSQLALLGVLIIMGMVTWFLGTRGGDALPMAVGLVFGVLVSLPGALLVYYANTRRRIWDDDDYYPAPRVQRQPQLGPPYNRPEPPQLTTHQTTINNYYGPVTNNVVNVVNADPLGRLPARLPSVAERMAEVEAQRRRALPAPRPLAYRDDETLDEW